MADIDKSGTPSLSSLLPQQGDSISGLYAGEALGAFDACYIKASDGKVYKSTAENADEAATVRGYAAKATDSGEPVTLYRECRVEYGTGGTPGENVFLSAVTAGALADATSANAEEALGYWVDATRLQLWDTRRVVASA
jgi:hypothetical protein